MSGENEEASGPLPLNTIATSVTDEKPEYAGGQRMYAVLFEEDYDAVSMDANGDVAVLLNRE